MGRGRGRQDKRRCGGRGGKERNTTRETLAAFKEQSVGRLYRRSVCVFVWKRREREE